MRYVLPSYPYVRAEDYYYPQPVFCLNHLNHSSLHSTQKKKYTDPGNMPFRRKPKSTRRKAYTEKTKAARQAAFMRRRSLPRLIKRVSLSLGETKKSNQYSENLQLFHNITNYKTNLLSTTQGVRDPEGFSQMTTNRVGDEVVARGIKIRLWLSNKADRPNCHYHVFVFRYRSELSLTDTVFWRGQDGLGSNMNRMVDQPNPERIKIIRHLKVSPGPMYSPDHEHSYIREMWIPLKSRKLQYREGNSTIPRFTDIGFAIVPYDNFGSGPLDNIASYAFSSCFYFKDP